MTAATVHRVDETTIFDEARDAVSEVLPRVTALLRGASDSARSAVGHWTIPDVACHLSHAVALDTAALDGGPLPEVEPTPTGTTAWTTSMLSADPERCLASLADRLDALGAAFLETRPPSGTVRWMGGVDLAPSAVACHLLAELLVHGHDVAGAARVRWPIRPAHAALAVVGGGIPIINACPDLWVRHPVDAARRARVELHLRGHDRFTLSLDQRLTAELPPAGAADAHLAIAPDQALLIFFGRRSPWRVAASGRAFVWGRRPQALVTLLGAITSP